MSTICQAHKCSNCGEWNDGGGMKYDIEFLKRFCYFSERFIRDPLEFTKAPFRIGDAVYATNRCIMVRINDAARSIQAVDIDVNKVAPVIQILDMEDNCSVPVPELPDALSCGHCRGTGISHEQDEECINCHGKGCKDCEYSGVVTVCDKPSASNEPCFWCYGRGTKGHQPIEIHNAHFNRWLLALIADLPGARFVRIDGMTGAHFVFDGGDGVLMPTRT